MRVAPCTAVDMCVILRGPRLRAWVRKGSGLGPDQSQRFWRVGQIEVEVLKAVAVREVGHVFRGNDGEGLVKMRARYFGELPLHKAGFLRSHLSPDVVLVDTPLAFAR